MKKVFEIFLGILTAIGGFVDMGDLVANAETGARFGLALPFDQDAPSDAELRIAQAQLVGWLEGLFHGIQATLFAQQMQARQQLEQMAQRGLPSGAADGPPSGTYL